MKNIYKIFKTEYVGIHNNVCKCIEKEICSHVIGLVYNNTYNQVYNNIYWHITIFKSHVKL